MAIIKQYHKDTDTTYVYESESYWDPELKQARSKRKCIGKIDPETGEIIPTGRRGRKKSDTSDDTKRLSDNKEHVLFESLKSENLELREKVAYLEKELNQSNKKLTTYQNTMRKIEELATKSN